MSQRPVAAARALGTPLRAGPVTVLVSPRVVAVTAALVAVGVLLAGGLLVTGSAEVGAADVWRTLTGHGSRAEEYAVYELRLPRVLVAGGAGLALGAAGAAFQTLVRNPLGSPDVVGFTTGSASGALLGILLLRADQLGVAACSVVGALGTAALVYGLARRDGAEGYRLVLLGIGVSAVLTSVNAWLITRADLGDALAAQTWLTGTLAARGWEHAVPLLAVVAVLVPALGVLGRQLGAWSLGVDTAAGLGVEVARVRLLVVATAVVLVAAATTAVGPVAFVALVAPHLLRLLARSPVPGPVPSGVAGAVLLLSADLLAQRLGDGIPVGVVTSAVGGGYLALLLAREWKAGRG